MYKLALDIKILNLEVNWLRDEWGRTKWSLPCCHGNGSEVLISNSTYLCVLTPYISVREKCSGV